MCHCLNHFGGSFLLRASCFLPLPTVYLLNESLFLADFWSKKAGVYICIHIGICYFVICTIVLYTTCYIVRISVYVQWQLHRIPVHRSGPVHGVWWTGGPGLGSKWIPVRNPICESFELKPACALYIRNLKLTYHTYCIKFGHAQPFYTSRSLFRYMSDCWLSLYCTLQFNYM